VTDQHAPDAPAAPHASAAPDDAGAPVGRRHLLGGLALGGVAVAGGAVGAFAVDATDTAVYRRQRFTLEVACLGELMRTAVPAEKADDADARTPFLVEGWIYPPGTIKGDGFIPTEEGSLGRWFCRGWFIIDGSRSAPHTASHHDYVMGSITPTRLFPPNILCSMGLEGTDDRGQTSTRAVIGGTGDYLGATGQVRERLFATNTSVFSDGSPGLCFNFDFDIRVLT
jgi:hypothetical protein